MDRDSENSINESNNLRLEEIDTGNYPESFDWRTHEGGKYKDCITPIENQGGCGSC
jgi:hypothetical protein